MTPTEAVHRGFALVNWLATELNGLPVEASRRNELSAACLSIAQDHHTAVIVLLERELYASAVALVRSQYEAYVLGLWLHLCATEQQLHGFAQGTKPPPIASQLSAIECHDAYREGQLSSIKAESWSAMCSFTHTGALQVARWITATGIEQNYPPEDLVQTANFTGSIALLSAIGMATLANRMELSHRLLEKSREHAAA